MIDLTQATTASSLVHTVSHDPGTAWRSDSITIDAPPDSDTFPFPNAQWSPDAKRTGICGVVSPRIVALSEGGYRMYYTQMVPRVGFPEGANDYSNASSRILSATSSDGLHWVPEPGVRLSPLDGGAGQFRVVSSEVVPLADRHGWFRMYYECCRGPQSAQNSIRSAISNGGLFWKVESGARLEIEGCNISAPRIVFLEDGRIRLYCSDRSKGIISAVSDDGGTTFELESGIRMASTDDFDAAAPFAPEILRLPDGGYRMYYARYLTPGKAHIFTALSEDGLNWDKSPDPVLSPGASAWNAAKCSEMCVFWDTDLRRNNAGRFRMFYEACDGTAPGQRGVWRIASAMSDV